MYRNKFLIPSAALPRCHGWPGYGGLPNLSYHYPSILILDNDKFDLAHNNNWSLFTGFLEARDIHGTVQLHQEERLPASLHHSLASAPRHVSSV